MGKLLFAYKTFSVRIWEVVRAWKKCHSRMEKFLITHRKNAVSIRETCSSNLGKVLLAYGKDVVCIY